MLLSKQLYLIISNFKIQFSRILIFSGLILTLGFINWGCNKQDDSDEYYIKYEVSSSTIYSGGKLGVKINSDSEISNITINTRSSWETTIGPVKKGFQAMVEVNDLGNNHGKLKLYTQISVSKNGSPFALKKIDGSDTPRTSVRIDYTIDY